MRKNLFLIIACVLFAFIINANGITAYDPNFGNKQQSVLQDTDKDAKAVGFTVAYSVPSSMVINPVPFNPLIWIRNDMASTAVNYWVKVTITDLSDVMYIDSVLVAESLFSANFTEIQMAEFAPEYLKQYMAVAEVVMDTFTGTDTLYFSTYDADAAVNAVLSPSSSCNYFSTYTPGARFLNNGAQTLSFYAYCDVFYNSEKVYRDSVLISDLTSSSTIDIYFKDWTEAHGPGLNQMYFYTNMKHDVNRENDTMLFNVNVGGFYWEALVAGAGIPKQWSGSCVDADGKFYVVGGFDVSGNLTNTVQVFDSVGGWLNLPSMSANLISPSVVVIDSYLIVAGGLNGSYNADAATRVLDLRTNTWSLKTPPLSARGLGGGGVVNNKMYLVGGNVTFDFASDCPTYVYDFLGDTVGGTPWQQMTDCPRGSSGLICGAPFHGSPGQQYVYATGGYEGDHSFYRYEPSADTIGGTPWLTLASTPTEAGGKNPTLIPDGASVYVLGGDIYGSWGVTFSDAFYKYDFSSDLWSFVGFILNQGVEGMATGKIGDKFYTAGGTIGSYAISPMPFERYYDDIEVDYLNPFIVSSNPYSRQTLVPLDQTIILAFSEKIETVYGYDFTLTPNPGLVMFYWSDNSDTLFIFHDDFEYNESYYVQMNYCYDTLGFRCIAKNVPNPIGFSTGVTGIDEKFNNKFAMKRIELISTAGRGIDFNFYTAKKSEVNIEIYNLLGVKIKDIKIKNTKEGINSAKWNSTDNSGNIVSSGVYMFKVTDGKNTIKGKLTIIK